MNAEEINATEAHRAEDFARAFNRAAFEARGWRPCSTSLGWTATDLRRVPDSVPRDVQRMVDAFSGAYARRFAERGDPVQLAQALTLQWWAAAGRD